MDAIVAVYDDWGIGRDGTQPIALSVDRKFFREMTRGAMVIVGSRTVDDFPGKKPLPGRVNVVLSRKGVEIPGFVLCDCPEKAAEMAKEAEKAYVIGGGTIYRQMLPLCHRAVVTKVHVTPESDTYFPNLDEDPNWVVESEGEWMEHEGVRFRYVDYKRV